jgi:hypothetical protein
MPGFGGYNGTEAGKDAAKQTAKGTIDKNELKERYKKAKDLGQGEEFKRGYGEGASQL